MMARHTHIVSLGLFHKTFHSSLLQETFCFLMYDVLLSIYKINLIKKYIVRYMSLFALRSIPITFHRPSRYARVSGYPKVLRKLFFFFELFRIYCGNEFWKLAAVVFSNGRVGLHLSLRVSLETKLLCLKFGPEVASKITFICYRVTFLLFQG